MEDEFRAVKAIMDTLIKHWPALAPDTRLWLKSRFQQLDDRQLPVEDVDRERV